MSPVTGTNGNGPKASDDSFHYPSSSLVLPMTFSHEAGKRQRRAQISEAYDTLTHLERRGKITFNNLLIHGENFGEDL